MSQPLTIEEALARAKKASKRGNTALAVQLFSAVLQQQPNHPVAKKALRKLQRSAANTRSNEPSPARLDAIIASYNDGQLEHVEQSCRKLRREYPRSVLVNNLLGSALQAQGKNSDAVAAFDEAIRLKPDFAEAYSNRANALRGLGRFEESVACYDKAITLKPEFADAYYNRANALKDMGNFDAAIASYEGAIRFSPGFSQAHRSLSMLKTFESGDDQIDVLEKLLSDANVAGRAELCFALAKAYEDTGRFDESFARVEEGNRLRKLELGYHIEGDRMLFAMLKETFSAEAPAIAVPGDETELRPILVVGMMRSGTSLVEQILATHTEVHGAGELEDLNQIVVPMLPDVDAGTVRQGYLQALAELDVAEKVVTDKMPMNFRWLGHVLTALPEAKVVHVTRDPVAICWSIYKHYFPDEGHGYGCDLSDLAEYYSMYVDLMSFWNERFPDRIYALNYESLTENQEEETRKLLEYCDLEWQPHCLDFHETRRPVKTVSARQVRRKLYRGSSEAWRRYEHHLQPLVEALEI